MNDVHYYETHVKWDAGRKGMLSSPELLTQFEVATPPQFPKGMEGIWSPEHLLVAAVESCVMTTFLAIAEGSKLEYKSYESRATGKLIQENGKYLISEIMVYPTVVIMKEADRERADRILQKTELHCLISNSVKAKISMITRIEAAEVTAA